MVATKSQAKSDLKPYVDRLRRAGERAIQQFLAEEGAKLAFMTGGTKATLVRDYIVREIRAEFPDGEDGVTHHYSFGLFLLNIKNKYYVRFKKLDGKLRTRNQPTQLSLDYLLQRPLLLFPFLDEVTNLNFGYKPGDTLASSTFWITCPDGSALYWYIGLSDDIEPLELPLSIPPMVPGSPGAALPRPKARPKANERTDGPDE